MHAFIETATLTETHLGYRIFSALLAISSNPPHADFNCRQLVALLATSHFLFHGKSFELIERW
jgi:hypothetical protein